MLKITKRIFELAFDLITGKEYPRFLLAEALCRIIYPKYKFSDFGKIYLEDEQFLDWYKRLAINEYMQDKMEPIINLPTGQAFVIKL